jgi:hypothetical protein
MRYPLERPDWALLSAYLLAAVLGTATSCLLVHDGAILLTAAWLGNAWDIYFGQNASRAVSTLMMFGPVWGLRRALDLSAETYIVLGHALYFATPLVLWLVLRRIETSRLFSRLFLAFALPLVYFLTELVIGGAFWLMWLSLAADPARSNRQVTLATLCLGAAMALSHPTTGLMSLLFLIVLGGLKLAGRPLPRRLTVATAALTVLLIAAYLAESAWLPATNPTILIAVARIRYDYVDPRWMLATLVLFPMLAAMWLLLLAPGINLLAGRWRFSAPAIAVIALLGVWFAAAGAAMLTWLYARHTGGYILVVATALALLQPGAWLEQSRRPLMLYAAIVSVAFVSYNVDLALFGRFVDRQMSAAYSDVEKPGSSWPAQYTGPAGERIYFKWGVGRDYARDYVVPTFDWYRLTLAFYSYFRSHRTGVLFHPLGGPHDWLPYECPALALAAQLPHDEPDRKFLAFLAANYCPR